MIKLCILDLDGTALDTIETISYYGNYALGKHGIESIEACEYKYLVGTGISNLIKNMLNFRQCYTEETFAKVFHDYDTAYNADVSYKSRIYDGLKEALDKIKALGVELAIVSNKPDYATQEVVRKLYGENYFTYVTGKKDGYPLKPDPTVVLNLINEKALGKDECIYIGDTSTDMLTGKNAGLFTVGVLWGFRGRDELLSNGADMLAKKPCELYEYVLSKL